MKRLTAIFFLLPVIFYSCQKEVAEKIGQPNEVITQENQKLAAAITSQKQKTYLNGYIINEQRQPVAGASVACGGKVVVTDAKGFFYFKGTLDVNKDYALITVSKAGYRKGFRTFTPNRNKVTYHSEKIMLQLDGTPQFVPVTGGAVTADGIKLTFPSYSVVKPGGYLYSGNVQVMIRYINPASGNFPLMVPGMLSGLNSNGEIKALQSFGMANVEISDGAGNKLEIAPGKTVKMEIPAPANGPATIPLWHFNETYGIWIQQGTAVKTGNVYVAEVNHFSIWNVDLEFNDYELNLQFQTSPTSPIPNLQVDVYRPNNVFLISVWTDNAGQATLINCSSNEALTLKMAYTCDTVTYSLAPVTQTRTETITLSATTNYTLNGMLLTCSSQPIPNQAFQCFLSGAGNFITMNGVSDGQGRFNLSTVMPVCQSTGPLSIQTTAFLNNLYYISSTATILPGINTYNPKLCDTLGASGGFNDNDVVSIPDPNLQLKVRQAINKPSGTIYYVDVKNLNYLDAASSSVQSIIGLQYFTGLDSLYIASNNISDLTPLQNLTGLVDLILEQNNISNITPLQNLTSLRGLYLGLNQISNITPVQNLTSLQYLGIDNNQVSNITALQNLVGLKELFLYVNQISNLTPLQNLTALQKLEMNGNDVTSIAPLQNLASLQYLELIDNQITSLNGVQGMTSLKGLSIGYNQISDLTPLQNLTSLTGISVDNNQVSNVTPLQNLATLQYLALHDNQITTITPITSSLPLLVSLSIIVGNSVPANEITAFQATHAGCTIN